jgi:hypothetical protein
MSAQGVLQGPEFPIPATPETTGKDPSERLEQSQRIKTTLQPAWASATSGCSAHWVDGSASAIEDIQTLFDYVAEISTAWGGLQPAQNPAA